MSRKKVLAVAVCVAVIIASFVGCTAGQTGEEVTEPVTQVVTEVVTDNNGEAVTEENGEAVTEVVTDANGEMVTEVVTTPVSVEIEDKPTTRVVTQAVTKSNGEKVTKQNGEVVTEVVTKPNGEAVTEVVSTTKQNTEQPTTAQNGSTTSSYNDTTQQTTSSSTDSDSHTNTDVENSTQANNTTTSNTVKPTVPPTTEEPVADNSISIVLNKNRGATCKSPNVSVATGEVIIDKPGDYVITQDTSEPWHGQIIIKLKNTEEASFRFENVHISNDTKNIIQILDSSITSSRSFLEAEAMAGTEADDEIATVADNDFAPNVSLSFPTGTSSTLETKANAYTGVIYNESKLTIKGNGSATIRSKVNANNCICSTKSITVKNVALSLETAQNENTESLAKTSGSAKGIFSYSKVIFESGFLKIKSNGDGIRCDRFYMESGTANIKSSACDGIDADDSIIINGGTVNATALQKYSFKVRRVNNSESMNPTGQVRAGKGDCFQINAGNVTGESAKITSLDSQFQSDGKGSAQAAVLGKIIKQSAGTDDAANESKVPAIIKIGNWSSINKCTKFLYSSSQVKKGQSYSATANGNSSNVAWSNGFGVALIKNNTNQ